MARKRKPEDANLLIDTPEYDDTPVLNEPLLAEVNTPVIVEPLIKEKKNRILKVDQADPSKFIRG